MTTTLLRALGIPARSVTNFASAHDTDNTMTIDKFVHENNEELEGVSGENSIHYFIRTKNIQEINFSLIGDSVWNFHVWNEVFLRGTGHWPDKYAGWAAVDATPQESSNGMMQCGPAPLKVIFYFTSL